MIVISEADYLELKEQIKKELLDEQRSKLEPFGTICQREQSAIFNRYFPESMFLPNDKNRRWKIRSAVSTMTNVLRPRQRVVFDTKQGRVVHYTDARGAAIHSEMELETAIQTFEAVCAAAHEAYRDDVTPCKEEE